MTFWSKLILVISLCASALNSAVGATSVVDPVVLVQTATQDMINLIKATKKQTTQDPEKFKQDVTAILDPVIDFNGFARSVMGIHANERNIKNLKSEAEQKAARERIQRFTQLFRQAIMDTYANSLLKFNGQKIETLPLGKGEDINKKIVGVQQKIFTGGDKPYQVQYTMRRVGNGWKIFNVIIEGINLGQTYRTQFSEEADKYKGDLDKVIAHWKVQAAETVAKKK
jgi:phospholipid transport system substrate-binding protein